MSRTLRLPRRDGTFISYTPSGSSPFAAPTEPFRSRVAYAAAHAVADPIRTRNPMTEPCVDWDATLRYRHHLWSLGFGVAEAMDTAQRGMGLDWTVARELITRSLAESRSVGGTIACGAGTDHLAGRTNLTIRDVLAAYEEQCGVVQGAGGRIILMASRALAACAQGPEDYARVYGDVLRQVDEPVILHWLGDMFDPVLAGYWGSRDLDRAMDVCCEVIAANRAKIDGIKISLLDKDREIAMRRRLPDGVKMYTGDDFNYPELIQGDEQGYSHALLGIFDAIAPAAAAALNALDRGDTATFNDLLAPTVPLSRHIFSAPTFNYKTGVVFMAYLNGHQHHFRMIGGQEGARSITHLAELFVLADRARLLVEPDLAIERMRHVLALSGVA